MMPTALLAALSLLALSPAEGLLQDPAPKPQDPPPPTLQDGPQKDPAAPPAEAEAESGMQTTLTLIPRLSRLTGNFNQNNNFKYEEIWKEGFGLLAELDFTGSVGKNWRMGAYVSLGADHFSGDVSTGGGFTLDTDPLTIAQFMTGFKVRLAPEGGFYFDGRAGLGAAYWLDSDEATLGTFVESSAVFAAEIAAHVGYSGRSTFIALGIALRQQEAPDVAFFGNPDEGGVLTSLEFELGFRF